MTEPITFTDGEGNEWTLLASRNPSINPSGLKPKQRMMNVRDATLDDIARAGLAQPDTYLEAIGEAIDHDLGWNTPEDEERGEYSERIRQVARELEALRKLGRLVRAMHNREELTCNIGRLYEVRDLLKAIDEARK